MCSVRGSPEPPAREVLGPNTQSKSLCSCGMGAHLSTARGVLGVWWSRSDLLRLEGNGWSYRRIQGEKSICCSGGVNSEGGKRLNGDKSSFPWGKCDAAREHKMCSGLVLGAEHGEGLGARLSAVRN